MSRSVNNKPEPLVGAEEFHAMLHRVGVPRDGWDTILVGDGSGSIATRPCGWACIQVDRATMMRTVWHGWQNRGTVNHAELFAYLGPLLLLAGSERKDFHRVYILTDSQYSAFSGNAKKDISTIKANRPLWAALRAAETAGVVVKWIFIDRDTVELNVFADELSRYSRLLYENPPEFDASMYNPAPPGTP